MTRRRNRADNPEGGATGTVRPSYWLTGGYLVLVLVPAWLYVGYAVLTPARAEVREPVAITGAFDAEEAAYIHQAGDNAVHGQVLLRPRNGGLLACTGDEMLLVPRTQYAEERIGHLYGSAERAGANNGLKLGTADPGYKEHMRRSRCDARGTSASRGLRTDATSSSAVSSGRPRKAWPDRS